MFKKENRPVEWGVEDVCEREEVEGVTGWERLRNERGGKKKTGVN